MSKHYRSFKREKRIQKEGVDYAEPQQASMSERTGTMETHHRLVKKYQCSLHAAYRFAERVLHEDIKKLEKDKIWSIGKYLRSCLPTHLINESKMHMFDNYYAVINGGVIVTIIDKSKKKKKR